MHTHETLERINSEWPNPLSPAERRVVAIQHLESRLGVEVDRDDPMICAMAGMEMTLQAKFNNRG